VKIRLTLNGRTHEPEIAPGDSLMQVVRRLGAKSVKNGCDRGDCGSCAVLLDGRAVNACLVFAAKAEGRSVTTVESLDRDGELHPLQSTALDLGAVQCGFCTPGILILALDLLAADPDPTEAQVREALTANYCRCTGWVKPVEAILAAAAIMREEAGR
jgi:aerobic-type carbon monoxide dehydrogenase small subunit (CoxS/CutS family)